MVQNIQNSSFQSTDKNGIEFQESMEIISWFSPTDSYIMITPETEEVACGAKATFDVSYTFNATKMPASMKFFYLVRTFTFICQLHPITMVYSSSNQEEKLFIRATKL